MSNLNKKALSTLCKNIRSKYPAHWNAIACAIDILDAFVVSSTLVGWNKELKGHHVSARPKGVGYGAFFKALKKGGMFYDVSAAEEESKRLGSEWKKQLEVAIHETFHANSLTWEVVEGDALYAAYKAGFAKESCMTEYKAGLIKLWSTNPDVTKLLLISRGDGKKVMRALLHKDDEDRFVLDRTYPSLDELAERSEIEEGLLDLGVFFRKQNNLYDNPSYTARMPVYKHRDFVVDQRMESEITLKAYINNESEYVFPYSDSYCFIKKQVGDLITLTNNFERGIAVLKRTDGSDPRCRCQDCDGWEDTTLRLDSDGEPASSCDNCNGDTEYSSWEEEYLDPEDSEVVRCRDGELAYDRNCVYVNGEYYHTSDDSIVRCHDGDYALREFAVWVDRYDEWYDEDDVCTAYVGEDDEEQVPIDETVWGLVTNDGEEGHIFREEAERDSNGEWRGVWVRDSSEEEEEEGEEGEEAA